MFDGAARPGEERVAGIERAREVVALAEVAIEPAQDVELGLRLDAFGDHGQAAHRGEFDDQAHEGGVFVVVGDAVGEFLGDLQDVERERAQVAQ